MSWVDRFNFPSWNLAGWCVIVGAWLAWEIYGATHFEGATFTYLVRNSVPRWGRFIAWGVLGWHFLWYDAGWWKSFLSWLGRW